MITKELAYEHISELVSRFDEQYDSYKRPDKYRDEFDFIWDTFSKERVLKGSFDRYVKSDIVKKGTATVDKEFTTRLTK
jgi:hypothetical protein